MKTAAVYSPYFDTLGGGEKYSAAIIQAFLKKDLAVDVFWESDDILQAIEKRYGFNVTDARVFKVGQRVMETGTVLDKYRLLQNYNYCFFVSDGSVPFLFAKKNWLHFQVPFHGVGGARLWNQIKLRTVDKILCNSQFTKSVIDREFKSKSLVLYPPATMIEGKPEKEKLILSVGRFDNLMQSKRQDVLVQSFQKLAAEGWQLVLAGGMLHGSHEVERMKQMIGDDDRIRLLVNPDWEELESYFAQAALYWHAAGFGADEKTEPEKMEHFGIAVVEAMSAGAVPVAFAGGGLKEVIDEGETGYLWTETKELLEKTRELIENEDKRHRLSNATVSAAQRFSLEAFNRGFSKLIG